MLFFLLLACVPFDSHLYENVADLHSQTRRSELRLLAERSEARRGRQSCPEGNNRIEWGDLGFIHTHSHSHSLPPTPNPVSMENMLLRRLFSLAILPEVERAKTPVPTSQHPRSFLDYKGVWFFFFFTHRLCSCESPTSKCCKFMIIWESSLEVGLF